MKKRVNGGFIKTIAIESVYLYKCRFETRTVRNINRIRINICYFIVLHVKNGFLYYQKEYRVSILSINAFILFYFTLKEISKKSYGKTEFISSFGGCSFHSGVMLYSFFLWFSLFLLIFFIMCVL